MSQNLFNTWLFFISGRQWPQLLLQCHFPLLKRPPIMQDSVASWLMWDLMCYETSLTAFFLQKIFTETCMITHHATLHLLQRRRVINPTQWGNLYPPIRTSVSSKNFDITLLTVLLRNICSLSPPATGWDALPPATDMSSEADIARVKYFRNTVYGHAEKASVDDATFNVYWQDIKDALVRLGGPLYEKAVNKLKNECMDPVFEEHYRELLKEWKRDDDNTKDKLDEIDRKLEELILKASTSTPLPKGR